MSYFNGNKYIPNSHIIYLEPNHWAAAAQHELNKLRNKCHSLSRFECYQSKSVLEYDALHEHATKSAHLFYNSVECAEDVLSGINIRLSVLAFLITLFAILI